ncbi:hypothetical protein [uncultured Sulfitobacter sp.]|uniref:hypothetical protein n=1 Tax=uncultured Sulfitobacter sp. TaxID=191468 RepID=UPI002603C7D1|nr:hypothetical protein [uncultured Sulfitobacter sp.]
MIDTYRKPLLMGAFMGLMMMAMLHLMLASEGESAVTGGGAALAVFLGGHVAVLAALGLLGWWAARFSPALRDRLAGLHRPTARHMGIMFAAALVCASVIHLIHHGGV